MLNIVLFFAISVGGALVSWRPAGSRPASPSGLYRFLAFELLLALALLTRDRWFVVLLSAPQMISWVFWTAGCALTLLGFFQRPSSPATGAPTTEEAGAPPSLPPRRGIYKAVRHPFYAAALLAGWGLFAISLTPFDTASVINAFLLTAASLFLVSAARADEMADYLRFGSAYAAYVKTSKMLIPFVL